MRSPLPWMALALAACGGTPDDDAAPADAAPCAPSAAPSAPAVLTPAAGARDVEPATVEFALSAFADADGDAHAATELEVWRMVDGAAVQRAWTLRAEGAVTTATLAQGAWENDALVAGGLAPYEDYAVRGRYVDDGAGRGACEDTGPWSDLAPFRTTDGGAELFDSGVVRTIELTIAPEVIDALNAEAYPPECVRWPRTSRPADVVIDGEAFPGVGVRIKGGCGSARDFFQKPSLKVSLSWDDPDVPGCPATRRYLGQRTLTLNNGVQDPTAKHEAMGYRLYRAAGVPAPRVAHAWVRVNGEDYGLYQLVETIDRRMLSRFFDDNDGMMYEGAYWCDLVPWNVPADDTAFSCFQRSFEPDACDAPPPAGADPTDWELLRALTAGLDALEGGFYPAVRELFDFDRFLSMWAADAVLSHWDAYSFHIVNNYRVYHDPRTGLWTMLPWGIDQTFDGGGDVDPWSTSARMIASCASDPACDAAFAARLAEVTALFESLDFAAQSEALHARLRPFVEADPRKEYVTEDWEARRWDTAAWIAGRPARIRELLLLRGFAP